jgi:hypothetical protein
MDLTLDKKETDFINKALADYNNKIVGTAPHEPLHIIEYNKNHEIVAIYQHFMG